MEKIGTFKKVKFTMSHTHGYGQYVIESTYKGKNIRVHSTNSEAFDCLEDDSNMKKFNEARKYCYNQIKYAYEEA